MTRLDSCKLRLLGLQLPLGNAIHAVFGQSLVLQFGCTLVE